MENEISVFEGVQGHYQPASNGLRFANYLIDIILFYAFYYGFMFALGIIIQLTTSSAGEFVEYLDTAGGKVILYLLTFILMIGFFTLIEGISKGRTLGKLITGTVAIREDGSSISWRNALMRSLCRLIPFEPFSALSGHPWHDTMTKTVVIKKVR